MSDPMSEANVTELRINTKAAINAVNSLAKRLEASNVRVEQHEKTISYLCEKVDRLVEKNSELMAKLYEAGVR